MYYLIFAQFCYIIKAYRNFVGFRQKKLHSSDGLYALSFYESLNTISLVLLFKVKSITGFIPLDWIVIFIFLLVLNSLFFYSTRKYEVALRKYDVLNVNNKIKYAVGTIIYIVLSILIVFIVLPP